LQSCPYQNGNELNMYFQNNSSKEQVFRTAVLIFKQINLLLCIKLNKIIIQIRMVPTGLDVTSAITRLIPSTSWVIH